MALVKPTPPEGQGTPPIVIDPPVAVDPSEARLSKIENTLEKITDVLATVAQSLPAQPKPKVQPTPVEHEKMKAETKSMMIPEEWRAIVDEYLGIDFDLFLKPSANGNYSLLVIFPPHIDRRTGVRKDQAKPDETMFSPIRLGSTTDDVKKWCELTVQNIKNELGLKVFNPKQHPNKTPVV